MAKEIDPHLLGGTFTMCAHSRTTALGVLPWLVTIATVGCASTPGAKPDDMSAEEHNAAAQQHEAEAQAHEAQYDPEAQAEGSDTAGRAVPGPGPYNPTAEHARHAAKHREHAADHEAAAKELEAFEAAECADFTSEVRKSCPLMGKIVSYEDIDEGTGGPAQGPHKRGVRVHFAPDVDIDAVVKHMRCHLAFARKTGHKGMTHCPLYVEGVAMAADGAPGKGGKHGVKGHSAAAGKANPPGTVRDGSWRAGELRVERGAGAGTVDLLVDDEKLLKKLRDRVRAHMPTGGE